MNTQSILDQVRVATPCHARWEDMEGDHRARFCGQCRKNVYNLSAMTPAQIETLVREKEGRFCGRFYARPDGRLLVNDCPTGRQRRRDRWAKLCGSLFAFALFVFSGCSPRRASPLLGDVMIPAQQPDKPCPPLIRTNTGVKMGEIDVNQPMMGRISVALNPGPAATNAPAPSAPAGK